MTAPRVLLHAPAPSVGLGKGSAKWSTPSTMNIFEPDIATYRLGRAASMAGVLHACCTKVN